MDLLVEGLTIMVLCAIMGTMFSMVSRSRNRDNMVYHVTASAGAQTVYLLVLKQLIELSVEPSIMPFYITGMVVGSVSGAKISMYVEKWLIASADGHLEEKM